MYIFRFEPEPADFANLANFLENAPPSAMHTGLWINRVKMIARLRAVAIKGTVEIPDLSIYQALRLLVY